MKFKINLLILTFVFGLSIYSYPKENIFFSKKNNLIKQIKILLVEHQKSLEKAFKKYKKNWDEFDKSFYKKINFINDSNTKNFLKRFQFNIQNNNPVYYYASYSKISVINGYKKAVHYEYKSNGKYVMVNRKVNNNGNLLKASYKYNIQGNLLEVNEFKNNSLINYKSHKIKV